MPSGVTFRSHGSKKTYCIIALLLSPASCHCFSSIPLVFEIPTPRFLPALTLGMVSPFPITVFLLGSLFVGSCYASKALSVVMSRPEDTQGFPYFHFISGVFYGFVAGACFMGYLTWKYVIKPVPPAIHTNKRSPQRSCNPPPPVMKNALVQGPVTYIGPRTRPKDREYDPPR